MVQYLNHLVGTIKADELTLPCRYKPDVDVRFLTEELGFESDQDCAQFLCDHGAEHFLEQKDGNVRLATGKVGALFETRKAAAFGKVDIKGQI